MDKADGRQEKVNAIRDEIMEGAKHFGVTAQEIAADTIHDLRSLTEDQRNGVATASVICTTVGFIAGFVLAKIF